VRRQRDEAGERQRGEAREMHEKERPRERGREVRGRERDVRCRGGEE
jgi:hypothetical protein